MAARTERDTLNGLIEICRDGARGFQFAAAHVADPELKRLFTDTARQRDLFAAELLPYAYRLGGDSDAAGTAQGALHRGWMRLRDAISGYDERMILDEARRGESAAVAAYKDAIDSLLPPSARPLIERQYRDIRDTQGELFELSLPCS